VVIDDRRVRPSNGYRAVHVIVDADRPVEIQVRTHWQHWWAEFSEAMAVIYGDEVKYGGQIPGHPEVRAQLDELSVAIAETEAAGGNPRDEPTASQDWFPLGVLLVALVVFALTRPHLSLDAQTPLVLNEEGPVFLIRYDRAAKQLLSIAGYPREQVERAHADKLAAEVAEPWLEIVLLEASTLHALEETHSRYFGARAMQQLEPTVKPAK
jgi:hypothetical protein